MRRKVLMAALGAAVAVLATTPGAVAKTSSDDESCRLPVFGPGSSYHPEIDTGAFTADVDNPRFPLVVGRTLVYSGAKDGKTAIDLFHASRRTRVIDGVRTRVVEDRLFLDGVLEERTSDYYAQDDCGNVWYFGEDTAELDGHGNVTGTEGSFHAGVDGAQPGVFMQASPEVGRRFRQEWYAGHAEDTYKVIGLSEPVRVAFGSFPHALRTAETTALEPGVLDNKLYVRGIGEVVEKAIKGPREKLVLVDILE
jgi:hypothetical protein